MLDGLATIEGCGRYFSRNPDVVTAPLGATGLLVSRAGFGCYRVAGGTASHEAALRLALATGINLVDTSANYTDGQSERVVGHLLAELVQSGELAREEVVVVTKGGYLQGENLALSRQRAAEGNPFEEVVPCDSDLAHCIHPDFLADQIEPRPPPGHAFGCARHWQPDISHGRYTT